MTVRTAVPADDSALVALRAACYPFHVITEAVIRNWEEGAPPEERRLTLVAEVDGEVVAMASGRADLESADKDVAAVQLMVLPAFRRRGVGRELYDRVAAHLRGAGLRRLVVRTVDADGLAFGTARGLAHSRTERISWVDPRTIEEPGPMPEGLVLRSFADLSDLRPVYELDCTVSSDVPSDTPFAAWTYEEWERVIVKVPTFDLECSMVAFDGDRAVSMACVETAGTRMFSGLAGTLSDYRGKGLARIVKSHALRAAAAKGVRDAYTNNDASNAPMLAVNKRLGYRPHVEQTVLMGAV